MNQFIISGQPDVNGVHALARLALLLAVFVAGVWRLRAMQ